MACREHIFRFLRVYVINDEVLFEFLKEENHKCFEAYELERVEDLPFHAMRDHPFLVIAKEGVAR